MSGSHRQWKIKGRLKEVIFAAERSLRATTPPVWRADTDTCWFIVCWPQDTNEKRATVKCDKEYVQTRDHSFHIHLLNRVSHLKSLLNTCSFLFFLYIFIAFNNKGKHIHWKHVKNVFNGFLYLIPEILYYRTCKQICVYVLRYFPHILSNNHILLQKRSFQCYLG